MAHHIAYTYILFTASVVSREWVAIVAGCAGRGVYRNASASITGEPAIALVAISKITAICICLADANIGAWNAQTVHTEVPHGFGVPIAAGLSVFDGRYNAVACPTYRRAAFALRAIFFANTADLVFSINPACIDLTYQSIGCDAVVTEVRYFDATG